MPQMAECPVCEGFGDIVENGEQKGPCTNCSAVGSVEVGVFDPICARHCHLCEGADHHWSFDGAQDHEGEPLMSCRHCPALRQVNDDDTSETEAA